MTTERQSDLTEGIAERPQAGEYVVGAVLIAAAAFALSRIPEIPSPVGYSPAGPRFMPVVVCVVWLALAVAYLAQSLLRRRAARPDRALPGRDPADKPDAPTAGAGGLKTLATPAVLILVLVAYQLLLEPLGYILSTALAFVAAARVLGSNRLVRDVVIGVLLALAVYFAFVDGLAIRLPQGVLPL